MITDCSHQHTILNLVCASLESDSCMNVPTNGRTPDDDDGDDVKQCFLFELSRYPDGVSSTMYMLPSSSPPRTRTHDHKHQKKKFGTYFY